MEERVEAEDGGALGPTWAGAVRNFNNAAALFNRNIHNLAAPPGPCCPPQPADALGLARLVLVAYL